MSRARMLTTESFRDHIERANRRHRMDERNRIYRMMECAYFRAEFANNERHADRLNRLQEHCRAELDILNQELGL